jgi:hypothetical protein
VGDKKNPIPKNCKTNHMTGEKLPTLTLKAEGVETELNAHFEGN